MPMTPINGIKPLSFSNKKSSNKKHLTSQEETCLKNCRKHLGNYQHITRSNPATALWKTKTVSSPVAEIFMLNRITYSA